MTAGKPAFRLVPLYDAGHSVTGVAIEAIVPGFLAGREEPNRAPSSSDELTAGPGESALSRAAQTVPNQTYLGKDLAQPEKMVPRGKVTVFHEKITGEHYRSSRCDAKNGSGPMKVRIGVLMVLCLLLSNPRVGVGQNTPDTWKSLAEPSCCCPSYGAISLSQGCCEFPPSCCRDVWAGYCEAKRLKEWKHAQHAACRVPPQICLPCAQTALPVGQEPCPGLPENPPQLLLPQEPAEAADSAPIQPSVEVKLMPVPEDQHRLPSSESDAPGAVDDGQSVVPLPEVSESGE